MRIGISTSVIERGQTGIAQHLFGLLRAFSAFNSRHHFTAFVLEEDLPLFKFAEHFLELTPVSERFRAPLRNILWHQTHLPKLVRAQQLEVLHVPSYRRMLWTRPCALVATIHDLAPFHLPKKYDWKRMFYARRIVRHLARRQDEIIAVSENTARDIAVSLGLPRARVTVIHNGIDHDRFSPGARAEAKSEIARRHGWRDPFFLYVARLEHPAKNHLRLIAAFNQFKLETGSLWHLALGGSDWHGAAEIHAAIRSSPYANHIHALGFVADEILPTWYRAADVFVYPSLYEGFGIPPVESMACGCPVLSSTRGALGEVIGQAAATVDPEDVCAMQWQLKRLAGDPALRESLRAAGLIQARRFDWIKSAACHLEIYARAAVRAKKYARALTLANQWT